MKEKKGLPLQGRNAKAKQEAIERAQELKEKYKNVKIFIAVPSTSMVHAEFAMSLAALVNHCTSVGIRIALNNTQNAEISHVRNLQTAKAEELKSTHILFIDSDMVFPPFAVQRIVDIMLDTESGVEKSIPTVKVLGLTVPRRVKPYNQVAKDLEGKPLNIQPDESRGVIEIGEIGTGFLMLDMEVFKTLKQPYFEPYYKEGKNGRPDILERVSEDLSFIYKLKDIGYKIYCDLPLSMDTKHIGNYMFDFTSKDFFADAVELKRQKIDELFKKHLKKEPETEKESEESKDVNIN